VSLADSREVVAKKLASFFTKHLRAVSVRSEILTSQANKGTPWTATRSRWRVGTKLGTAEMPCASGAYDCPAINAVSIP
jgi:hypothetical protein